MDSHHQSLPSDATGREGWLAAARAGDRAALGELLESYRPFVRMLVRGARPERAKGRLDDSDLMQDAVMQMYRHFDSFQGTTLAEFVGWLRQTVVRQCGHEVRRHLDTAKRAAGREVDGHSVSQLLAPSTSTPSAHAMQNEQAARMAEALSRLPEDMQTVLLGRHMDELSYTQLAERLQRSEGAVRVLYTRAVRRLQEECGRASS